MFNSFIDGSKSAIEMTAVCNATGLAPQTGGLAFPPASRFELADVCKPRADGGTLEGAGVTEVVSSVDRGGRDVPHHLALGTYVVIEADSDYTRTCFREYHMLPDRGGRYAALYRPIHMIGLELGVSVASAALRKDRRVRLARGALTWSRSPSGRCAPARCSTVKVASASGAGRVRPSVRSPRGFCRSGLPIACGSRVTWPRGHPCLILMWRLRPTTRRCGHAARWRWRSAAAIQPNSPDEPLARGCYTAPTND
jgi:hypothetical protein